MVLPYRRARAFESDDFDSLVERMSVLQMMKASPADRWFKVQSLGGALATSSKDRVFFDMRAYDALTGSQRLAVAAHELTHIKQRDSRHQQRHVAIPGYLAWGASFLLYLELMLRALPPGPPAEASSIIAVLAFVASSFTWLACLVVLLLVNGGWRRAAELRCDLGAVAFTSGEDMIGALRVQEGLLSPELKKSVRYRMNNRLYRYPSFREREEAIRRGPSS